MSIENYLTSLLTQDSHPLLKKYNHLLDYWSAAEEKTPPKPVAVKPTTVKPKKTVKTVSIRVIDYKLK